MMLKLKKMKHIRIYLTVIFMAVVTCSACKKLLEEDPRSDLTPEFLSTAQGLKAGLDAAYAGTRTIWGCEDYFSLTVPGTDEFMRGNDGNTDIFYYSSTFLTNNGKVRDLWRNCYTFINTCNGVIENAPNVTTINPALRDQTIAEARVLRAIYYFVLVQQWGGITINKTMQLVPVTSATRSSPADVYQFIIDDLQAAIPQLPASPVKDGVLPGKLNAAAARHFLTKVFLTRAGSTAGQPSDYLNAYTTAKGLIDNSSALGLSLLPDFGNVFKEGNETNVEVLWSVQHTPSLAFNGSPKQDNRTPDNMLVHLWVPQYDKIGGLTRDVFYGRPYIRCVPTPWLLDTVFKERVNDTRYNKSFQTVWYCNSTSNIPKWEDPLPAGAPAGARPGQPKFKLRDTAAYMPGHPVADAAIKASPYLIIPPGNYTIRMAPPLIKYFDSKRSDMLAPSIRPIIAYRLAETYLMAAEALVMLGRTGEAVPYVNAVRERAAFPTGNAAAMRVTAADLNLDFLLDERSRELCGENMRWLDLARTNQLIKRVRLHNGNARNNIQAPKHLLRPIPQVQIDGTTTGPAYPQNQGW